jgi:hypothetical protein
MVLLMLDVRVVMAVSSCLDNIVFSCYGLLLQAREEDASDLRNSLLIDEL